MTLQDTIIAGREAVLNRLLCQPDCGVLNADGLPSNVTADNSIAAELKRVLSTLKGAVLSADGNQVDYDTLRGHTVYGELRDCAAALKQVDPLTINSREEQLAFWINLYNALVIDGVIRLGVQNSVAEKHMGLSFFRWAAYDIGGHRFSLDDIEHGILRGNRGHPFIPGPQFGPSDPRQAWIIDPPDVRIHFALNCASHSCPPIGVYDPEQIEQQLDLAARSFIHSEVRVHPSGQEIWLSRIFMWYSGDFGGRRGIVDFLQPYLKDEDRDRFTPPSVKLAYQKYDWSLNAAAR